MGYLVRLEDLRQEVPRVRLGFCQIKQVPWYSLTRQWHLILVSVLRQTSLCLNFLMCKIGKIILSGCCEG